MRVFISYRRADTAGHAGRLCDALQTHFGRDNVFMDLSGIDSGQNFVEAIDTAVRSSDALVAIIGDEWLTCVGAGGRRLDHPDDFVRAEIAVALGRGIPIVPVLVEGASMPPAVALPDVLKPLATLQAQELSDRRWSYDVERLIDAIEKLAGRPRGWPWRTRSSAAAAFALIAILGTLFVFWMQKRDSALQDGADAQREAANRSAAPPAETPPPVTASGNQAVSGPATKSTPSPAVDLAGDWSGEITYSWGATHTERFNLRLDGNDVFGTASFLGTPRAIISGTVNGNRVTFHTQTEEISGDWNNPKTLVHRYRGAISGNVIKFYMQSEGAGSSDSVDFTVTRRVSAQGEK